MRSKRFLGMVRLFVMLGGTALGVALGCGEEDVACDPETEIEVLYGSDISDEPPVTECEVAPASCVDAPSCACLEGQMLDNGLQLDFCLEEGSCELEDGVVAIVCPGG